MELEIWVSEGFPSYFCKITSINPHTDKSDISNKDVLGGNLYLMFILFALGIAVCDAYNRSNYPIYNLTECKLYIKFKNACNLE